MPQETGKSNRFQSPSCRKESNRSRSRRYRLQSALPFSSEGPQLEAIRAVHLGRGYIPQKIAAELAEHYSEDDLSEREIEVLREVARGTSNKIIASHLSISEATVKAHLKNIMLKLGASDRTHAVNIATTAAFSCSDDLLSPGRSAQPLLNRDHAR